MLQSSRIPFQVKLNRFEKWKHMQKKPSKPFKMPAYVGIILIKNNTCLLVKRHNTDWASGSWNFPGGLLEQHESLIDAAAREAHEEIGVIIAPSALSLVHVLQVHAGASTTKEFFGFYFTASSWQGEPINSEPHRHSEIGWFALDALPETITKHALQALEGITKGVRYSQNRY